MDNLQPLSAQEYTQEKAKLEAQMEALKAAQAELERRYCLGAPFQPGDKVQVTTHKGETRFLFIDKVMPGYYYKKAPGFRYDVVKCKADGTPAAVRVILSGTEEESMVKV